MATLTGTSRLVFAAHSIPIAMEATSGPSGGRYTAQLRETATLVAGRAAPSAEWDLVWQSRSGPPHVPWLEPDINDHLAALAAAGVESVVISPIGFTSDHLEVIWDLDTEATATAQKLGLRMARAARQQRSRFVAMVGPGAGAPRPDRPRGAWDPYRFGTPAPPPAAPPPPSRRS
jgi:ferrochelatase